MGIETDRNGKALKVGLELLGPGRAIAQAQSGRLTAVVAGCNTDSAARAAASCGADRVIVVDNPALKDYSTAAYTQALFPLVKKYAPEAFIIGATANGRDLTPRLSSRLVTGLTADCTELGFDRDTGCVE